jgi:GDP-L-fucose synthase
VKVLVTGSSGFLGSWFLDHFIRQDGHDVWGVDIVPHPAGLPMDVQDMEDWLRDFEEDVDLAIHLAAPVGGRMKIEFDPMYNADAFRLDSVFFRWATKHAKVAVYPSSSAIYPVDLQGRGAALLNEDHISPRHSYWGAPDELYGFSKLAGEYMAWKAAEKHGLNVLCIRPFSGYGPGQSMDYPVPSILQRAINREDPLTVWGGGQTRDFVYVSDIVKATMSRLAAGVSGYEVMNIASGIGVTFEQIAELAAGLVGYRPEIVTDPSKPVGVLHRHGDPARMQRHHRLEVALVDGLRYAVESMQREPDRYEPPTDMQVQVEEWDPGSMDPAVTPEPLVKRGRRRA